MNSMAINVRVLIWHFQWDPDHGPSITRNEWHRRAGYPDGLFSIYAFFGFGRDA